MIKRMCILFTITLNMVLYMGNYLLTVCLGYFFLSMQSKAELFFVCMFICAGCRKTLTK